MQTACQSSLSYRLKSLAAAGWGLFCVFSKPDDIGQKALPIGSKGGVYLNHPEKFALREEYLYILLFF